MSGNAKSGRKPKPTHLRLMAGNPGGRPYNKNEPKPVGILVDPPEWMTDSQKEIWRHAIAHAPHLLLTKIDSPLLEAWVVCRDIWRRAVVRIPSEIVAPNNCQSPYVTTANRQVELMLKIASELGFTPSSRTRITVGEVGDSNPFAKFK